MGFGIVDIVNAGHDNTLVLNKIDGVVLAGGDRAAAGAGLLLPGRLQLLQHGDDPRLLIGLQNVVKRFQLKRLDRMLFPRGNKHNKRLMRELADVLRQQHAVQRRNIDIEKQGIHLVVLKVLQHVQTVIEGGDNLHLAVRFDKPAQLLLGKDLIFNDDNFHCHSPV